MTGLELAKGYYEDYGKKMLLCDFEDVLDTAAIGLLGAGSECLGYDDEVSQDKDFEPGFCIFLPGEDVVSKETEDKLKEAYAYLPNEYENYIRKSGPDGMPLLRGVIRIDDFLDSKLGNPSGMLTNDEWLDLPEQNLLEVTNGELFHDTYGMMTQIRETLAYYPKEVRLRKLSDALYVMGQTGQNNYMRCVFHGDGAAASLCINEFVTATLQVVYLINKQYMPYYKWRFKGLRLMPKLSSIAEELELLMVMDNATQHAMDKSAAIESIATQVLLELADQRIITSDSTDLCQQAGYINDRISNNELKNHRTFVGA